MQSVNVKANEKMKMKMMKKVLVTSVVARSLTWRSLDNVVYSEDHFGSLGSTDYHLSLDLEGLSDAQVLHAAYRPLIHVCKARRTTKSLVLH